MAGVIDSHCHLNYKGLREQQDDVIARAREAGVTGFLTVNTTLEQYDEIARLAAANDDIWCSVGVHPHSAGEESRAEDEITARAANPRTVAVGETGLDYYYDNAPRAAQAESFRRHVRAARRADVPLIIHTRDADEDTLKILREARDEGGFRAVIHCFSGTPAFAQACVDLGCYISFSGIVTFKRAEAVKQAAKIVPADRLLVETDAPFLAPVPHRGKTCEPAFVTHTAAHVAELRAMPADELAEITTANFFSLFNKAA